ncbi:MAG TPA: hypothetical protein VET45_00340 [Candidatus Binatia bacterium]|nr:hypothetical protein [Candidatus Binatia bacterium]
MQRRWRNTALVAGVGLYFTGLGFMGGVAADRIWHSRQRVETLRRYENEVERLHGHRMRLDHPASAARESSADDKAEVR